ncbi:MAG: M20/M25/M40 family metallo-hydrolase [Saprospiraceae bacterium]|nr:M20/M25/M40 family metallo-hydrolase [Saprospiraceae bacterium]
MANFFKIISLIILGLFGVLVLNTFRSQSKQLSGVKKAGEIIISDSVITHLSDVIKLRTVSNSDPTMIDSAQFQKFTDYVAQAFPLVHNRLEMENVNTYALFYEWKGKNPSLKPVLLMGHFDVVPVIQGTERLWEHKPFDGEIANGFVYGRGTLDDKTTVIGVLEAVEYLLKEGFQPERTFYLAFGHDEEVLGKYGAKEIASILAKRKVELEYVLDEGGMIKQDGIEGLKKPIAMVGVAEKGYVTLQLTATGEGGHSSMPPPQTSIGDLAEAIDRLQKHPFPYRLEGAAAYMLDYLGPEMPFANKMAMANRWLMKPVIISSLSKSNSGSAMLHTTTAPTILDAGLKENVLPIDATAKINFRILPGDSVAGVIKYVKKVIKNDSIKVDIVGESGTDPSFISDTTSLGFRMIHTTIKSCFPDVLVAPYLVVGATDSRHFKNLSCNIYRFMPVRFTDEDIKRFHGTNERISIEDFKNVVRFYMELISRG